ncbi:hypothetical protein KIN20_005553 [Parelaphostrongylus tenuis]|uniref:Uncharacterized protein n=1 Tax=Parelaphostrongylus tenuis TaxID=148309 RepID=A0AAD5MJ30_PARTN|nr:hypothetical protein KIN20_005553 [Parelaphostrongylus tenuis]
MLTSIPQKSTSDKRAPVIEVIIWQAFKSRFLSFFVQKVSIKSLLAAQLQLIFDNVLGAPFTDPELPEPFRPSSAPDFVELGNGSSTLFPELLRWLDHLFDNDPQFLQFLESVSRLYKYLLVYHWISTMSAVFIPGMCNSTTAIH